MPGDIPRSTGAANGRVPDDATPIVFRAVHKRFGEQEVIRGLDLSVSPRSTTVIMGESGSGKSVLIKLMNGLLLPDGGQVLLFGHDTRKVSGRELMGLRRRIATVFQNYALFDSMSVRENATFPLLEAGGLGRREIRERVDEVLEIFDLVDAADRCPPELSGGMKKRVSLARALVGRPEVVLFDEPTTGLDPILLERVDQMILDARERFGLTSVIISHDMASALELADELALLRQGRIAWRGTPAAARRQSLPALRRFLDAEDSRLDMGISEGGASEGVIADEPEEEEGSGLSFADLPVPPEQPAVCIHDVRKSFERNRVLRGMNWWALPGEITTLIGGSGSGKTVMMKHILGLMRPDSGSIQVLGRELVGMGDAELRRMRLRFGTLFQSGALLDSMTIAQNAAFALRESLVGKGMPRAERRDRVGDVLERLRIADLASRWPSELSSGQRKRAALARAIVTDPEIVVYDEPTTGLDPVMTTYVNDMIVEARELFDVTALVISHDMASTFRISHRIAMIHGGRILAFGTPDDIRASDDPRVQHFIFASSLKG